MKAGLVAWVLFALTAAPACASGYSDFDAGIAARNGQHCDLAIAHETAALATPDLLASFKPTALLVRGECQTLGGNFDAAAADFTAALALKPDDIRLHLVRGLAFDRLKRYDAAAADYQDVIRLRPDLTAGYVRLGALYAEQKQMEAAIGQFTALIGAQPAYGVGYLLRSRAYLEKGDMDGAIADADHIVEMAPQDATGYIQRAAVYQAQSKFDKALSNLDDALNRRHGDVFATLLKGSVQWELGHFSDTEDTLETLVKNDTTGGYSLLWFDIARLSAGKPDPDFSAWAARVDRTKWPGQLVALYAGQSTAETVTAAVAQAASEDRERDLCESDFYLGTWQLLHQAKDAGLARLQKANGDCPMSYVEHAAAAVELGRLK